MILSLLTTQSAFLPITFLLLMSLHSTPVAVDAPSPDQLLDRMETAVEDVSYLGKRMVAMWLPDRTISHEERVIHQSDGRHLVVPDEPFMQERGRRSPFGSFEHLKLKKDLLLKNYDVNVMVSDKIAGRQTYQLHIVSRWEERPSKKLWLDQETAIVVRAEHYDADGTLRSMFVFSHITYDADKVEDAVQKMEKMESAQRRGPGKRPGRERGEQAPRREREGGRPSWTRVADPELLRKVTGKPLLLLEPAPEGFVLLHGEWMKFNRNTHIQLRYADGLTVLSLFQSEQKSPFWRRPPGPPREVPAQEFEIEGEQVKLINGGIVRLINWSQGERHFTLISELGEKVSLPLVRSMLQQERP